MTKLQRYIIVCIIFLAFLPLLHQFMRPHMTANEIFSKNFVAQKFLVTRQGYRSSSAEEPTSSSANTVEQKTLYYEAVEAYSKEEYATSVLLFERYLKQASEDRKDVALYLGIAYLGTDQLDAAQEEFQYLLKNGSANKKQDAEWYLVLTLLKKEEVEQVSKRLTSILTHPTPHAYQEKAQALLEEIQQQYHP